MRVLNLYSGIGGNRKLWDNCNVTAVEIVPAIAKIYKEIYPYDNVIIGDAKQYLLENYDKFDFIWASPPCITHSKVKRSTSVKPFYQDMSLYEIILFMKNFVKCDWIVENVITFYKPLIQPTCLMDSHYFWSNVFIMNCGDNTKFRNHDGQLKELAEDNQINIKLLDGLNYSMKRKLLRNCTSPVTGKKLFDYVRHFSM